MAEHASLTRRSQAKIRGTNPMTQALTDQRPGIAPMQLQDDRTSGGMPTHLAQGVEKLSGVPMDDVRVHYNSSRPQAMQALAYAQGRDIHLAAGQEQHLPHEAWHVVQQAQGRVKPTTQLNGNAINDSPSLEREADRMGRRASKGG